MLVASSSPLPTSSAAPPVIPPPETSIPSGVLHTPPIQAGPGSGAWGQQIVTFSAKQELLDDDEQLLGISDANNPPNRSPACFIPSVEEPHTPVTPAHPQPLTFHVQTPQDIQQVLHQPTPVSWPKAKGKGRQSDSPATQTEGSPSVPRTQCKPKPKQPKNDKSSLPPH
ncbi:hypothetical protein FRC08_007208 [Ceratobasidium sp. 394]|nr:hypothetical protein FRC08_007208 [Ceratobasidium sp. 394]KAG9097210.1 hypothetical protein FS749_006817 [Ceratobasidium sp. UAMH 11750]